MDIGRSAVSATAPPLVALDGIVKRFGAFVANDHIDLEIRAGEIHALLGENGAGKSTLVKMLYGLLRPTEGRIVIDGAQVTLESPDHARRLGVGMVFQHFSLFENLTVADNIALVLDRKQMPDGPEAAIARVAQRYGLALDPHRPVWSLSAGERQRIEIARCLLQEPRLIILDEPTSVLTPQEADKLFETLERLKAEGRALLYISHRLDEVKRLCDRATILRRGKIVGACDPRQESARSLAAMMVGAHVAEVKPHGATVIMDDCLVVENLSLPAPDLHATSLVDISLVARFGEVLGIAGIAGNGQAELFAALSGETLADAPERIRIAGKAAGRMGVDARRKLGAAFVPEERNGHAAAPDFSLSDNAILTHHATGEMTFAGFLQKGAARELSKAIVEAFDVRTSSDDPPARSLSGGNLQKFVVGREVMRRPSLLIVNQPTWGVDAAASAAIRQALLDLAARGAVVVVISQDLDELFEISFVMSVIHAGQLSPARLVRAITREEIGLLMGGMTGAKAEKHGP